MAASTNYAGFWKRFVAYIIDAILISVVLNLVKVGLGSAAATTDANAASGVVSLIISWIYFAYMESSDKQATFGKMALGIRVTDLQGKRITFGRATGRFFSKILSGITLCIGYMMAGWTQKKQALHDLIAGTLVVNTR